MEIYTVGHGNRAISELLDVLEQARIETLIDVRRYPSSRRNPQFNSSILKNSLRSNGIDYIWEGEALGGHRESYETHMQSDAFIDVVRRATQKAKTGPTVLMCAEMNPSGCHRSLLCDHLTLNGVTVHHLIAPDKLIEHRLHPDARLVETTVIYEGNTQMELDLQL